MIVRRYLFLPAACAAMLLGACAPQSKYAWGNYESSLYDHYKTPGDSATYAKHLAGTIKDAESSGKRVPPGVYAEYGEVLMERGDAKHALYYFEKEKRSWPESTVLMNTMIRLASNSHTPSTSNAIPTPIVAQEAKQ